jgi:hypothetical protein
MITSSAIRSPCRCCNLISRVLLKELRYNSLLDETPQAGVLESFPAPMGFDFAASHVGTLDGVDPPKPPLPEPPLPLLPENRW